MAGESFQHSWAVCRTPWHNEVARVIMLVMASLLSVIPTVARAESQITPDPFADNELAAVILVKDKGRDVEGKLGAPCVAPAVNRESVSLAYRAADGTSLRFVVNVSPSDVHYQLIESMTMSMEPNVSVTCYTPAYASLNIEFSKIHTGRGIRLGEVNGSDHQSVWRTRRKAGREY